MVTVKDEVDRVVVRMNRHLAQFVLILLAIGSILMSGQVVDYAIKRFSPEPFMTIDSPLMVQRRNFTPGEVVTVRASRNARIGGDLSTELRVQNIDTGDLRRIEYPGGEVVPGPWSGLAALWIIDDDQPPGRYRLVSRSHFVTAFGSQDIEWWTTEFVILSD